MDTRETRASAPPELYRLVFEANPQPMWVFDPSSLSLLDANASAVRHYGYTREELLALKVTDLQSSPDQPEILRALDRAAAATVDGHLIEVGVCRHRRKDGRRFAVELSLYPLRTAGSTSVLALAHDVTERTLAEQALWASEAEMRAMLETSLDAIVLMDAQGLVRSWNPRAEVLFGWSRDEAVGRPMAELIVPPRHREAHARGFARFLESGEGPLLNRRVELSALRRDGSEFPVEIQVSAHREHDSFVSCAFIEDITERKRAQDQIARAERQLATAQRITQLGSWQWNVGSDVITWSDEVYRIYGLEPQECPVTFDGFLSRVHPDDRACVRAAVDAALAGLPSFEFEERIVRPDGSVRLLRSQGETLVDAEGRVTGLIGTCQDVTRRRQEEDRLRHSEERFAKAFRASPAAITISALEDGRYLDVNEAFLRLIGRGREDVVGRTSIEIGLWVDPGERERLVSDLTRGGSARRMAARFATSDGKVRDVLISAELIELENERCILAQSEDVTGPRRGPR